jgi:hypothetical protein
MREMVCQAVQVTPVSEQGDFADRTSLLENGAGAGARPD